MRLHVCCNPSTTCGCPTLTYAGCHISDDTVSEVSDRDTYSNNHAAFTAESPRFVYWLAQSVWCGVTGREWPAKFTPDVSLHWISSSPVQTAASLYYSLSSYIALVERSEAIVGKVRTTHVQSNRTLKSPIMLHIEVSDHAAAEFGFCGERSTLKYATDHFRIQVFGAQCVTFRTWPLVLLETIMMALNCHRQV